MHLHHAFIQTLGEMQNWNDIFYIVHNVYLHIIFPLHDHTSIIIIVVGNNYDERKYKLRLTDHKNLVS